MKISSVKNEFGDPIGLPVGEVTRPGLPDESVTLTGNYCYLEVLDADKHTADLWSVYSLDTDGRLWTYMPQGPFKSEAEYRVWVEGVQHKADPFFYAIIDSETNKAVGVASFLRVDPGASSIEVGWITYSPVIQQKPIATEAMYLMMQQEQPSDYIICSGKSISLREIIYYVFDRLNISKSKCIIDKALYRPSDIEDIYGTNEKAKKELNWQYDLNFFGVLDILLEEEIKNYKK